MISSFVRQGAMARWPRALLVAVLIAIWPACTNRSRPEPTGSPTATIATPRLDFTLKTADGRDVRLADFKGRPMLINFWATWCAPCKAEIPWFVEFAERYKGQGLAVVGISVDDPAPDVVAFATANKVTYPMLLGRDHEQVAEAFDAVNFIPVSWLIRPDGSVHTKVAGFHSKEFFETELTALMKVAAP